MITVDIDSNADTINFYIKEDIQGWNIVKQCTVCKLAVFIGKSKDVDKSTNTVNEVFDKKHNCPEIF